MIKNTGFNLFTVVLLILFSMSLHAQTTIRGKVLDTESGQPLIGTNLIIRGTNEGTTTDVDGLFSLTSSQELPWTIDISYVGFKSQSVEVDQPGSDLTIYLDASVLIGQEVIVSASRRQEKIQDAPASVSLLGERQLSASPQISPLRNLITVPGVEMQQQSAGSMNITMRGQGNLYDTDIFPMLDYRNLIGAGAGLFVPLNTGVSSVDLHRIEIVRGPGAALYGPAVTAGVVHFISKNPIDYPGTAVELIGGEGSTFGIFARHAGKGQKGKFGYKLNAQYNRGDEFQLDPVIDAAQIAKLKNTIYFPSIKNDVVDATQPGRILLGPEDTDPDGNGNPMQDHYYGININGNLQFRPREDFEINLSGGMNKNSVLFHNAQGEGLAQPQEFWAQARLQKGGLFAQVFYVNNDGGTEERPSFLYQTGLATLVSSKQIESQIQYGFEIPTFLDARFTVGIDSRIALTDSKHLVFGRYEDDDDYRLNGGYIQGNFSLSSQLDLVLAGRYDDFNFRDKGSITPRIAFVYKPSNAHSFRLSYNKASRPPSVIDFNLDFPLASPVPGLFDLWTLGSKNPQTFPNPLIDVTIPGVPDLPVNTPGLPLAVPFSFVNESVIAGIVSAFQGDPALAPLLPLITGYLTNPANIPQGYTGTLSAYNIFDNKPFGDLVPTEAAEILTYSNYELGYKGLINNKWSVFADLYYLKRTGFTLFDAIGPTYFLAGADIATDLGNAIESGIAPVLTEALRPSLGDQAEATAALIAAGIGAGYATGGAAVQELLGPLFPIFGVTETDLVPQNDGIAHVPVGFRLDSDRSIGYWGLDIGAEYYFNDRFSAYGNYSYKSKVHWGVPGTEGIDGELPFTFTLVSPKHKYRLGLIYSPLEGFFGSISFMHDNQFYGQSGQFQGLTDAKNIFDGAIGYTFNEHVKLSLTATNLFDSKYRAFANFPVIRRRAAIKALFNF